MYHRESRGGRRCSPYRYARGLALGCPFHPNASRLIAFSDRPAPTFSSHNHGLTIFVRISFTRRSGEWRSTHIFLNPCANSSTPRIQAPNRKVNPFYRMRESLNFILSTVSINLNPCQYKNHCQALPRSDFAEFAFNTYFFGRGGVDVHIFTC